jgi:hypothetical protein
MSEKLVLEAEIGQKDIKSIASISLAIDDLNTPTRSASRQFELDYKARATTTITI